MNMFINDLFRRCRYIESTFRGIGEGWARFCYGGSTGGWESLAVQLKCLLHTHSK